MSSAKTGGINPAYDDQDGYDDRYPPDWEARKDAIKRRDNYTCQDCGIEAGEGTMQDVHHITHLSDGGSNRLDNLELLCIDCHNDRHEHDITEGRDGYEPAPGVWERLRQLVRYCVGSVGMLLLHAAALFVLLTESVGTPLWYAGGGYVGLLVVALVLRPRLIAALYGLAGGIGVVFMQVASVSEIATVSTSTLVLTAFVPAVLAGAWWWDQR